MCARCMQPLQTFTYSRTPSTSIQTTSYAELVETNNRNSAFDKAATKSSAKSMWWLTNKMHRSKRFWPGTNLIFSPSSKTTVAIIQRIVLWKKKNAIRQKKITWIIFFFRFYSTIWSVMMPTLLSNTSKNSIWKDQTTATMVTSDKPPTYVIVTPINSEKYMMFQVGNLRFLDSFQFM